MIAWYQKNWVLIALFALLGSISGHMFAAEKSGLSDEEVMELRDLVLPFLEGKGVSSALTGFTAEQVFRIFHIPHYLMLCDAEIINQPFSFKTDSKNAKENILTHEQRSKFGTILQLACWFPKHTVDPEKRIPTLIRAKADVNLCTVENHYPPLVGAAQWASQKLLEQMIKAKADVNGRCASTELTPLVALIDRDKKADELNSLVELLLSAHALPDQRSNPSPVYRALQKNADSILYPLLYNGFTINKEESSIISPEQHWIIGSHLSNMTQELVGRTGAIEKLIDSAKNKLCNYIEAGNQKQSDVVINLIKNTKQSVMTTANSIGLQKGAHDQLAQFISYGVKTSIWYGNCLLLSEFLQDPYYRFTSEYYQIAKNCPFAARQNVLKLLSNNFTRPEYRSDLITMSIERNQTLLGEILSKAAKEDVLESHYILAHSKMNKDVLRQLIAFDKTHDNEARAKKYEHLIIPVSITPQPAASVAPAAAPIPEPAAVSRVSLVVSRVEYSRASDFEHAVSSASVPVVAKNKKKKKKQNAQQKVSKPAIQVSASQKPKSSPVVQQKPEPLSSYSREERAGILAAGAQVIAKLNREEDALGLPEIASEPVVAPAAEEPLDKVAAASYPETISIDGVSIDLRHILDPKAEKPGLHHHTPAELEALRKSKAIIGESQVDALGIFKAIITGKPCTCFPAHWTRDKVTSVIAEALISGTSRSMKPTHTRKKQHSGYELTSTVDVDGHSLTLKLILNKQCNKVITAYPLYEAERAFPKAITVKW